LYKIIWLRQDSGSFYQNMIITTTPSYFIDFSLEFL
jgi:hypothetical protein